jgi:Zn finger protein HypA/HybF involved in hydrogenase expression
MKENVEVARVENDRIRRMCRVDVRERPTCPCINECNGSIETMKSMTDICPNCQSEAVDVLARICR